MQSGTKNPPWARSNVNSNMTGMNPQLMDPNAMAMSQQGMMPFQQSQAVFNPNIMQAQGGMSMPMSGQMPMNQIAQGQIYPGNVVAYPTPRAMNPGMYQNNQGNQSQPNSNEQRVFTGTVTKTHNDFGFVDQDVFYQTSVCAKGVIPKVSDRVLVEATYNPNMPFKWNATRVQVLPKGGSGPPHNKGGPHQHKSNYNAVPPPANAKKPMQNRRDDRPPRREDVRMERKRSRSRSRSRSRNRTESRRREASPLRKRPAVHQPSPVKYVVRVPRMPLDISSVDVLGLSQRYTNMYIPSDFFSAHVRWGETFPPENPFSLNNPCNYHIMSKEASPPEPNEAVLEPPDADYRYSAKVMLVSLPSLELFYQKCGLTKTDDKDKRNSKNPLHPTRLIKFLVGQKGKGGENFAIGGPWSPSLDGDNPQSDPTVLVKTAIRTCKALTGIDLTPCTQWYRTVEFYYWRESSGGRSRLETVVFYLPDVWSAQASRLDWPQVQDRYRATCEATLRALDPAPGTAGAPATPGDPAADPADVDSSRIVKSADDGSITIEDNDDEERPEATHYAKLDLKTIKVDQLRQELRARNVSCKGLRPQLVSRLSKLTKAEEEKDSKGDDVMILEDDTAEKEKEQPIEAETEVTTDVKDDDSKEVVDEQTDKKDTPDVTPAEKAPEKEKTEKEIEEEKRKLEKEKQAIRSRYELPTSPHLLVHPSPAAKGGKFNCSVATVSLLLDYRINDNKEHSFELFVFAELFNEMLMRDFGFYIYKTLYTLPEKVDEVKEKSADKDKKDEKVEKKDDKDKKEKDDKDKRDDKRDSRRRERRESNSDDERSSSPKKSSGVDLPADPYLLLSLVYFDTSRCGYLLKKDLQNLFMSLGLRLSRSQIRSILEKVCVKDSFSYKSLVQAMKELVGGVGGVGGVVGDVVQDLPLDDADSVVATDVPPHIAELEATIAAGNRDLLPVFKQPAGPAGAAGAAGDVGAAGAAPEVGSNGMVTYKGRVVDVPAALAAVSRGATVRTRLEAALEQARTVARTMRAAAAQTQAAERSACRQRADLAAQLARARARLAELTTSSKIFHSALKSIQTKVEAVVNIKYEADDDVLEVINGSPKIEKKDVKKEVKSDKEEPEQAAEQTTEPSTDEPSTETKEEIPTTDAKEPTTDIIATENMDIDDKE